MVVHHLHLDHPLNLPPTLAKTHLCNNLSERLWISSSASGTLFLINNSFNLLARRDQKANKAFLGFEYYRFDQGNMYFSWTVDDQSILSVFSVFKICQLFLCLYSEKHVIRINTQSSMDQTQKFMF